MASAPKLPRASRKSVLRVFLEVLDADSSRAFTQKSLEDRGVPDHKNAKALLGFLDLLTESNHLKEDLFVANRNKPERLRKFLREQLVTACSIVDADCDKEKLSDLGDKDLGKKELDDLLLDSLPTLDKEQNRQTRSNMKSCMRALHDAIRHCDNKKWLAIEAGEKNEAGKSDVPVKHKERELDDSPRSIRVDVPSRAESGGPQPSGASTTTRAANRLAELLSGEEAATHAVGPFCVGDENGHLVTAHVYFDGSVNSDRLRNLAYQLLTKAQEVKAAESRSRF